MRCGCLRKSLTVSYATLEREREREERGRRRGLPIGNLTSQLLANVYLNELDQFVKHKLGVKYYLRYADDFVMLSNDPNYLASLIDPIDQFLQDTLHLSLHPNKIIMRELSQGVDFLGYVVLPHYRVIRTRTKRRMLRRVNQANLPSYQGMLKHCSGYRVEQELLRRL